MSADATYAWIAATIACPPCAPSGVAMAVDGTPPIAVAADSTTGDEAVMLPLGGGMAGNANQYT